MHVVIFELQVKPEYRDEFLAAIRDDREGTIQEPGCLRFDVLEDQEQPNRFYLYEVYRDAAAYEHHRTLPHAQRYGQRARAFYAAPSVRRVCANLIPADGDWH